MGENSGKSTMPLVYIETNKIINHTVNHAVEPVDATSQTECRLYFWCVYPLDYHWWAHIRGQNILVQGPSCGHGDT